MSKLPSSKQIIKTLTDKGFNFVSQRGSHAKFKKDNRIVIIPSPKKEIPLGTFRSIVRQSGLTREDFVN
jgi:predicted RNA binding protein YcfA (HicA-like mRNA interferase family)